MPKPSEKLEKVLLTLENSKVENVNIVSEIEQSFLDYAMSVITSRALPDLKDGLKPVHRRIIFAAHQEGLYNNKKYKKSAALVGAVMGSYHPHGDNAIYESLVRMAQDFSLRYPIIEGQGNFGSIDGDSAAAMRYTEVKLSKFGELFLEGIKEDSVDFVANYDGSKQEPVVLPTIVPNILLNGCSGIAVGLATNMPPHNINEICNALLGIIHNPNMTMEEILQHIKGPDFPTGGEIYKYSGVKQYIETGNGSFNIRSKVEIIESNKKNILIVKEIPYGVKKVNLIKKIISLIKPGKFEEENKILSNNILNIRDESNLEGIRLIIEIKKDVDPEVILNNLYKFTPLQMNFATNMTVLVNLEPKVLNILEILNYYLEHQLNMLKRSTKFNLNKLNAHIHLLEGRKVISENLKNIIDVISNSENPESEIQNTYSLSEIQIKDIFSLPLKSIKKIEKIKLNEEFDKSTEQQAELKNILLCESTQKKIIEKKLNLLKKSFGDERKTKINYDGDGSIIETDLIPRQKTIIILSQKGYITQMPLKNFKLHRRGGSGVKGSDIYKDDKPNMMLTCYPLNDILIFTSLGKVYKLKAYELNVSAKRTNKGENISSLLSSINKLEKIITIISVKKSDYKNNLYLLFATELGNVKKTSLSLFEKIWANGKIAFKLKNKDQLKFVIKTNDECEILLASSLGKVVKFKSSEIRPMGRSTSGVKGIKLKENTQLVSASCSLDGDKVISVSQKGLGKITKLSSFRLTRRGSVGVIGQKINNKTGKILSCTIVNKNYEILLMTNTNKINRFQISDVSESGRNSAGVKLFKLDKATEKIVYFAKNLIDVDENKE